MPRCRNPVTALIYVLPADAMPIPDHSGYFADPRGVIWRSNPISPVYQEPTFDGYMRCRLGKTKRFRVHHLVLFTFVGPQPEDMETRHIDNDRSNNALVKSGIPS